MAALPETQHWTVDEYLACEEQSEIKHEYYAGEIYAMTGASPNHNRISGDTYAAIHAQLRGSPCEIFGSDQRVRVSDSHYVYPDISIVCGKAQFDDRRPQSLLNPTLLIEVLSPPTEDYDRGRKAVSYRALAGLQEFLLIAQDRQHITHYVRHAAQQWLVADVTQPDAIIELAAIHGRLALAEVYARVVFEEAGSEKGDS
ncbi:MAG: Uma2 family endonuclease [Chloroflexi bacterium]|nr:Uma2 family endonuclease [Chloroflexota bacterium]